MKLDKKHILNRFISYVTVDTESNPNNPAFPSSENQWNLAHKLVEELEQIGLTDVTLDKNCYIMATVPSNVPFEVPTIGFVAHIDTSPDFTGANVNPQVHENYDGKDIVLNNIKKKVDEMLESDKTFSNYIKKLQLKTLDPFTVGDKLTKSLLK